MRGYSIHARRWGVVINLLYLLNVMAYAQQLEMPTGVKPPRVLGELRPPGEDLLPPPRLPAQEEQQEPFTLPPVEPPPDQAPLSSQARVFVRSFRIIGNTVLSPEELGAPAAPYVGRAVTTEALQELRDKLTRLYIDKGYINSGVIIPDQRVTDGVIMLQVVEGRLARIEVAGLKRLTADYVRSRLNLDMEHPLRLGDIEKQLRLLHQNTLIKRVNGQLTPGDKLGDGVLVVTIEEERPYSLFLGANNHRPPSIGSLQGEIVAAHWNLTGRADRLELKYALTEGLNELFLAYSYPLSPQDLTASLWFENSGSDVVEEPFDDLDIDSKSRTWGLGLRYPIVRALNRSLSLGLTLEKIQSKTFLLGEPFSFSSGVQDGKSNIAAVRFIGEWIDRWEDQVIAVRSTVSQGIDAFGATTNEAAPDGRFLSWLGQFQWVRRFGDNQNQVIFRTDCQITGDPLLPSEKFILGGATSVRGYRENQLVRDNGLASSLEFRFPVFRGEMGGGLQLAAFLDFGRAWNEGFPTPDPESISSAGLGLRWDPTPEFHAEFYGAIPFRNIDNNGDDLQDKGIQFLLSYRLF